VLSGGSCVLACQVGSIKLVEGSKYQDRFKLESLEPEVQTKYEVGGGKP
jgi:hypothetical protein